MSDGPPIVRSRTAWQTDRLDECVRFYHELVGLPVLGRFQDHAGYDGVILGLPDSRAQLELTAHRLGSPASPSAPDDLLVLYLDGRAAVEAIVVRCVDAGVRVVDPENPYWDGRALVLADPDGRRLVLDWGLAED
jgi:catechol 2,3-dioxygenase-like lactoylglutathione lyase family enzyme